LGIPRRRLLDGPCLLIEELIDADQRIPDTARTPLIYIHLAVVARVILKCLATLDHLQVCRWQAGRRVVLKYLLQLPHVTKHPPTHARPTHWRRLVCALPTDVNNVVLD